VGFAGNERLRFESKDGYAIQGIAGSMDFPRPRREGEQRLFFEPFSFSRRLHRQMVERVCGTAEQRGVQGCALRLRQHAAIPGTVRKQGDGPESDTIDLHQAYFTVGNHKEFPLSLKVWPARNCPTAKSG